MTASNKEGDFQTQAKNINCKSSSENLSAILFYPPTFSGFCCRKPTRYRVTPKPSWRDWDPKSWRELSPGGSGCPTSYSFCRNWH